jgi:hypothetical protein
MRPFHELIVAITELMPPAVESVEGDVALRVSTLEVDLPIEAHIGAGAALGVSLPRGRLATGFDLPLGKVTARFQVVDR